MLSDVLGGWSSHVGLELVTGPVTLLEVGE